MNRGGLSGTIAPMFGWFNSTAREARQLNRDAPAIIDAARNSYRTETVGAIALATRDHLRRARKTLELDPQRRDALLRELRSQHRESRRKLDQVGLTAFTLIIIYLRALAIDEAGQPAIDAIEGFLGEWEHLEDDA